MKQTGQRRLGVSRRIRIGVRPAKAARPGKQSSMKTIMEAGKEDHRYKDRITRSSTTKMVMMN